MSWLFSRALVEASLGVNFSDGIPSAQSSGTPTPQAYCAPDKMTDFSRPSRFGMTFAPLTEDHGEAVLTWCLEGSLVRTSASRAAAMGSMANAAGYGQKWQGLLAKYDPNMRMWKTAQCSLLGDSEEFSETWPTWGLMLNGELFLHPLSERHMSASDCGWSAPTPTASDHKRTPQKKSYAYRPTTDGVPDDLAKWAVRRSGLDHARLEPALWEWMMGWPIGWTELKPLAMDKSLNALPMHGAA